MRALVLQAGRQVGMRLHQPDVRRWLIVIAAVLLLHVVAMYYLNQALQPYSRSPVRKIVFMLSHVTSPPPEKTEAIQTKTPTPAQTTPRSQAAPPAWLLAVSDAPLRLKSGTARKQTGPSTRQPQNPQTPISGQEVASHSETVNTQISPPNGNAKLLNNPQPQLNEISRALGESGQVVVRVLVGWDGRPEQVRLLRSSGSDRLDHVALETVRKWRFEPDRSGGQAKAMWLTLPVEFGIR